MFILQKQAKMFIPTISQQATMAPQISSWNPKFIQTQFLMITIIITVMITVIKVIIMDLMSISQVIMNLFRDQITTNLTLTNPATMNLS